jgi:hypothetical protein
MGINCCSHSNEAPEITITKPEKNMTSTNQNPIAQNQNNYQNTLEQTEDIKQNKEESIENTIVKFQKESENALVQQLDPNTLINSNDNQNNIMTLSKQEIDNIFNQEFKNPQNENQPLTEQQLLNNNIDINIKNVNQIEQPKINQNYNVNIPDQSQTQNNVAVNNEINIEELLKQQNQNQPVQNNEINIEELLKLQNQSQPIQNNEINIEELLKQQNQNQPVQNIQNQNQNVYLQNNQIAQNTQNNQPEIQTTIQNIQKIPNQNQNVYIQNNQIVQSIEKKQPKIQKINQNIKNIPNQNIENIQYVQNIHSIPKQEQNTYIQTPQNVNKNIKINPNIPNNQNVIPQQKIQIEDDIEKYFSSQPNNQNQYETSNQPINNDKYIEELLKGTSSGQTVQTNNDINLDVFFNQDKDVKIDDALINQLFESAGKPVIQSQPQINQINQNNIQDPLYRTQRMDNNQTKNNMPSVSQNYFSPVNSPHRSDISEPVKQYKQIYV